MQINVVTTSLEQCEAWQEELARKLLALMTRIQSLRDLVRVDEDGEVKNGKETALDVEPLRQGLRELEHMASELLYEVQEANGGLLLDELPGIPLGEALARLVDTTAENLGLSSRVAFAGWERPLSDYLSRLLYRVAQEALARVAAHEGARRLRFSLDYRRTEIAMMLEDDGMPGAEEPFLDGEPGEATGVPPFLAEEQSEKRGAQQLAGQTIRRLRSMIENLGGSLVITGGIEQGVQVQVRVPLRRPEHVEHGHNDGAAHSQETTEGTVNKQKARETMAAGQETAEVVTKIRVLLVDNQTVSRAGLRRLLESYPDLEVVGEASDSMQAVSETAELLPQIVLLDAHLPEEQSLETLRQVRQLNGDIHVLLLAGREDETLLYESLRAGAGGYILKDIAPDELAQAVRGVARGDVLIQPQMAARLLARSGGSDRGAGGLQESLTTREREVLQLLARGLRNKEIAARLFVSERTVNFHLANIYAKLHVNGRTEALSRALEHGLLKP